MNTITAKCNKCQKYFEMDENLYLTRKKHKSKINCPICLDKSKKERYKKIGKATKEKWANYTIDERISRSQKAKEGIANMPLNAKLKRSQNSSIATKKQSINRSKEDWDIIKRKLSNYQKNRYANMNDIERKVIGEKISKGLNNRTEQDKIISNKKRSETLKATLNGMSEEEKIKRRQRVQEFWDNMSPEYYQLWKNKQASQYHKYIDNLSIKPNQNELNFINYLKLFNISYKFQSYNIQIHPEFNKLFPFNYITGSKFVNPYHKWDFRLYIDNKEILVDIDGSIHFNKSYKVIHQYTKIEYNILDYYKFKDSQRIYQTDGLQAYIISCPDDNLTDESIVYDLITNESMSFKTFLSILNWMNLSNKEKRKLSNYYNFLDYNKNN